MIVTKRHASLMKRLMNKWSEGLPLDKILDGLTDEDLEYLIHLELAGLIEEEENGYELTQAGHLICEAIDECAAATGNFDTWDDNFKFIGSEIISMIEVARLAQGDIKAHPGLSNELKKRGMAENGTLLPVAESILEAYDTALPQTAVSPSLAEALKKCPPGPGKKSLLPFSREEIYRLEAMRLLTFSLPYGNSYSLTGAGQQIRSALLKGLVMNSMLDDQLLTVILQDEIDAESFKRLQSLGAIDKNGQLLPAGKALRMAAAFLMGQPIYTNPSISLSQSDFAVLETIDALWKKASQNPDILPSGKTIKEHLVNEGISKTDTQKSLHVLESFRLIKVERIEKGVNVYELTKAAKDILKDRKGKKNHTVSARSVMAITTTRMENLSPDDQWIELAEKEGLVGKGFPTKSGRLFAHLASTTERLPAVDKSQRKVLDVLPYWRGLFLPQIMGKLQGEKESEIIESLDRLAANGLLDILPGGLFKLTEAGVEFKKAMAVVPEGIEFHVTPAILRLLKAAWDHQGNRQINWKAAEKTSGLDPETAEETMLTLRKLMYVKGDRITNAGISLLEGLELLKDLKLEWEEIEI